MNDSMNNVGVSTNQTMKNMNQESNQTLRDGPVSQSDR